MVKTLDKLLKFLNVYKKLSIELVHITAMNGEIDNDIIDHFNLKRGILSSLHIYVNPLITDFLKIMTSEKLSTENIKTNDDDFPEVKMVTCEYGVQVFTCIDNLFVGCFVRLNNNIIEKSMLSRFIDHIFTFFDNKIID